MRDFIVFSSFLPYEQSLLDRGGEKEALLESRQAFEDAATRTFGLVNLVFSCQTVFFEYEHPSVYKPMIKTEPTVPNTPLKGLGSRLAQHAAHAQQRSYSK